MRKIAMPLVWRRCFRRPFYRLKPKPMIGGTADVGMNAMNTSGAATVGTLDITATAITAHPPI
jgi:hypothetical protein